MRVRLALSGIAAALALGTAMPAAEASPSIDCAPVVDVVCAAVCLVSWELCIR